MRFAGEALDVDSMVSIAAIQPYLVWRKGEQNGRSGRVLDRSGAFYLVSNADLNEVSRQISKATAYFERNSGEIGSIVSFAGVTTGVLDFGVRLEEGQFNQTCRFSSRFLILAVLARVEIVLTQDATCQEPTET